MIEVSSFTVGPVQENCHVLRLAGSDQCIVVDPGDEADRLLAELEQLSVSCAGILLTHTHFDHVGAVAPIARATGAEVWCPEIEAPVLADIMSFVPWPGFGPFESYDAENLLVGGEQLTLAGIDVDVLHTPGHSPGHMTFVCGDDQTVVSGDVLFQGSVGRVDLPGGDWATLEGSLSLLVDRLDRASVVYPGHGPNTTIGAELDSNPFLAGIRT